MNEESKLIWGALNSINPQKETEKVCRQILRQRIKKADFNDKELRDIVDDIVEKLDFSIEIGTKEEKLKLTSKTKNSLSQKLFYGTIGALGLCSLWNTTLTPHPIERVVIGFALTIISGFGFGKMYIQSKDNSPLITSKIVVQSTVDDIMQKVDAIYNRLSALFQFNQLEGRYQEVLRWLQYQYSYNTDKNYREKLSDLLDLFNYEMVEYDSALSSYFEERRANVPQMITTLYALRNKKDEQFILNGIVVFPMEQK